MILSKQDFLKCQRTLLFSLIFTSLGVSGCAVQTNPTTLGERSARADVDKAALFGGQEEIIKPLTLYEAIARAVKYNSEQKVSVMEQAMAYGIADSISSDMLPQMAVSAGFTTRSDRLIVSADSVLTGAQSLEQSYIEDKTVRGGQLQVVYNVLDFGISYVSAKQNSDRRYISEEIRRKSIQQIVHDVRVSFWKAAAAQRIRSDLETLISVVQEEIVRTKAGSPSDKSLVQLDEQKKLLTALKSLMALREDTLTAKAELARLMNLPPNTDFDLDIPAEMDSQKVVKDFGQIDLEHFALVNRPELRISDYDARIASMEAKKEILRMFPGIEFGAGINYNSNSYLKNKNWADAGVGVTWNLMNLFTRPQAVRLANNKADLERYRRIALTMAIMSQVNVSFLNLRQSAETFEVIDALDNVNDHMWQKTFAEKTKTIRERREALISAVDRLVSHLKRDFAYADYKGAESNLFVSLGVDPLPRFSQNATIRALAETLEDNLSRNAPRGFKEVSYDRVSQNTYLTPLSNEQRVKILEWTGLRRLNRNETVLADRDMNKPVVLGGIAGGASASSDSYLVDTKPMKAVKKPPVQKKAVKKKTASVDASSKLLQISSFETLGAAQTYWQEITEIDPTLISYAPIFREVEVAGNMRYRTFISGSENRLRGICQKLAGELKSCLLYNE